MKHILYSTESDFLVEEKLDSFPDQDIRRIEDLIADEITDCLFSTSLSDKSQGFFPNTSEILMELFSLAEEALENIFGSVLLSKVIDDDGATIYEETFKLKEILENRRDREQGIVDSGKVILSMLTNFLKKGIWQIGLQRDDGIILTDISKYPQPIKNLNRYIWQDSTGLYEPIIWFGLKNENPDECWTLDRSLKNFDVLDIYENPYTQKITQIKRWNNFWFCSFWTLDWNSLFNYKGDEYIVWMFNECGMDEPIEEFNNVRDSCPINLDENDSLENVIHKIEDLFIMKQKVFTI